LGRRHSLAHAELISELVVERLFITAVEPESGRTESGGQSRFGGRVGINLALRATSQLRLLVGADAVAMTPPVNIEVKSVAVGYEPAGSFGFTAGLRFEF